jgi:hypothetical protein
MAVCSVLQEPRARSSGVLAGLNQKKFTKYFRYKFTFSMEVHERFREMRGLRSQGQKVRKIYGRMKLTLGRYVVRLEDGWNQLGIVFLFVVLYS